MADKVQVHMLGTGKPATKLQAPTPNLAIRVASQNTAKAIIRAIQKMQREHMLSSTFLQGVVQSVAEPDVEVSIGGSTGTIWLRHLGSYSPVVGDTVWIAVVSTTGDMFVLGTLRNFEGGGIATDVLFPFTGAVEVGTSCPWSPYRNVETYEITTLMDTVGTGGVFNILGNGSPIVTGIAFSTSHTTLHGINAGTKVQAEVTNAGTGNMGLSVIVRVR